MTDLSPQAQAVLDAFGKHPLHCEHLTEGLLHGALPAALEAAADQAVPQPPVLVEGGRTYEQAWTATVHYDIRNRLRAIAAELRGQEALAQPEPQTPKKELTDEQLLKCFKIATPCYNMENRRRELDGMRAVIAADRALRAELRGQDQQHTGQSEERL